MLDYYIYKAEKAEKLFFTSFTFHSFRTTVLSSLNDYDSLSESAMPSQ